MAFRYNKKHTLVSVQFATAGGMVMGFWLGKRLGVAGPVETVLVLVGFIVANALGFSRIDAKYESHSD